MKLGCHAVLYKDRVAKDTENTIGELVYSGTQGIEVGARFFDEDTKDLLIASLKKNNLDLFGLHTSCNLTDFIDDYEANLNQLIKAASIAKEIKAFNVIMTGQIGNDNFDKPNFGDDRLIDENAIKEISKNINKAVIYIKENYGVDVLYHNHNWEFKNGRMIYNSLLKYSQSLSFAFDIGWAISQGVDYISLIKEYPKRFNYLHLRDCSFKAIKKIHAFKEVQNFYLNIGEGDVNYYELLKLMNTKENSLLVVEYETGEVDKERYKDAIDYLKGVKNEIN